MATDMSHLEDSANWIRLVKSYVSGTEATHLNLKSREIEVDVVKSILKSLPNSNITHLSLEGNYLADGMKYLVDTLVNTKVQVFNVRSCNLTTKDLLDFMRILEKTQITKLDISSNQFDLEENQVIEFVSYLRKSQLTLLNFGNVSFPPEVGGLPLAQDLPSTVITNLDLSRATLTHDALVMLFSNLPNTLITALNLCDNNITRNELEALKLSLKSSKLKILDLSKNSIDDAGIDILVEGLIHSGVEVLNLSSNDFHGSNSLGEHLRNTRIQFLNLSNNSIEERGMFSSPDLWRVASLVSLDVSGCSLGEETSLDLMRSLERSRVTNLSMRENNLQLPSITEFANRVKNSEITNIDFSENDLQQEGFTVLGNCLKGSKIKHINVSNNFKHPVGDVALGELIEKTKGSAVQYLIMNFNELMSYGAETIARSLINTTFTNFDLSSNWIEEGVTAVAANLRFTDITHLNLSNNKIEDEGAEALANCLKHTRIVSLNVNTNSITDRGAAALADVLKSTNILELKLEENDIENTGLKILAKKIENTFITVLDVKNNPGDRTLLVDSVLWKNRKATRQLIDTFKRIAPETSDRSIGFDQNVTSANVNVFLEDCLHLYRTIIKQPTAVSVLLQDKTITFSRSQIVTFMSEEFPREFIKFIGSRIEADVEQHVNFLRRTEEMGLRNIVELLLLNRPVYTIDKNANILHPYVYKLLKKYKQPLYNLAIEPRGKEKIIQYFTEHRDIEGASDVIKILRSLS